MFVCNNVLTPQCKGGRKDRRNVSSPYVVECFLFIYFLFCCGVISYWKLKLSNTWDFWQTTCKQNPTTKDSLATKNVDLVPCRKTHATRNAFLFLSTGFGGGATLMVICRRRQTYHSNRDYLRRRVMGCVHGDIRRSHKNL